MAEQDINKERLELALEAAGLDLWENDLVSGDVPRKALKIFAELGYSEDEAASYIDDLFAIIHPDDVPLVKTAIHNHLTGVTAQYRCEFRIRSKNGTWVWYANYGRIMDRDGRNAGHRFIGVTFNIDDRKRKEVEHELLNRALVLLSKSDVALIRAKDEQELLVEICQLLVEYGGYLMAWVGFAENDVSKTVRPVAQSGYEEGYLDNVNITWADTEPGQGPTGTAIRAGTAVPMQDIQTNPAMAPWREAAIQRGYQSSLALPLVVNNRVLGAITIYSVETYAFSQEEVALLEELANNLAYGIQVLRARAEHEASQTALHESEEKLRGLYELSPLGIALTDMEGRYIEFNQAFQKICGYPAEELMQLDYWTLTPKKYEADEARQLESLKRTGSYGPYEKEYVRKDGSLIPIQLNGMLLTGSDRKTYIWSIVQDITERKNAEAELSRIAHFDTLTSIPNRVLLADRMRHAIAQTARDQNMMAICYLDLDGFKPINDAFGHAAGDQVLIEVSKRIGNAIRGGDTVARLGGDEFVVLLLGLEQGEECVATLERLLATISQPITVKNQPQMVSASIGVSIYPLDDEDPDTLLRHADQAMYVSKQSGKNRFHIYDPALDKRTRDQHELLKSIRHGLENNQFELFYQPKVNLRTKELVGAEALIRWRHPERGLLFPAEFLIHIEKTDLDIKIGEWVTATALAQMQHWRSKGLDIEVSINISGFHMESIGFVEKLEQQLGRHPDLPFGKLQIEVLETVALNDITVVREIIESCRKIGVKFALDDFGTGYSSLSYLSYLPIDTLKIDQSFVRDMLEDKGDMAIVQGIIALARAFDRQTVAEGIETEDHYQVLLDMGCEIGQGYGIARPMPANELTSWDSTRKDRL